jgi:hypothetical protein
MPAGNDIVAWQHDRCRGKAAQQRFLDKTCLPAEQQYIKTSANADLALWLHWSLKEAAYKLSCFSGNRDHFHAIRFEVADLPPVNTPAADDPVPKGLQWGTNFTNAVYSKICFQDKEYAGCSLLHPHFIHSIVAPQASVFENIYWAVLGNETVDKNDFSEAVRHFALQQLNLQLTQKIVSFSKDGDGIPFVILANDEQQYISLSHDQQWLSFAFVP